MIRNITQKMLTALLQKQPLSDADKSEILNLDSYYLVAAPGVSGVAFHSGTFEPFVDAHRNLLVFLDSIGAGTFATRHNCVDDTSPLCVEVKSDTLRDKVSDLCAQRKLSGILFYARPPIGARFSLSDLVPDAEPPEELSEEPSEELPQPQTEFLGVAEARAALDEFDKEKRLTLDPNRTVESLPSLLLTLLRQNDIEPEDLDKALNLPDRYTRNYINSPKSAHPSAELVRQYLSYFGLYPYLYRFKSDSPELMREVNRSLLDRYSLKNPSTAPDRYVLKEIRRGEDYKKAYVYNLCLEGADRREILVSNPSGYVIGKSYVIDGLEAPAEASPKAKRSISRNAEELLRELEEKETRKKTKTTEKTYEEKRKDAIVGYFCKKGEQSKIALEKFHTLETDEEVLNEFYKYLNTRRYSKLEVCGYTIRKLVKELGYSPYDAHVMLIRLKQKPKETKQELVYRETEPQYQNKVEEP